MKFGVDEFSPLRLFFTHTHVGPKTLQRAQKQIGSHVGLAGLQKAPIYCTNILLHVGLLIIDIENLPTFEITKNILYNHFYFK